MLFLKIDNFSERLLLQINRRYLFQVGRVCGKMSDDKIDGCVFCRITRGEDKQTSLIYQVEIFRILKYLFDFALLSLIESIA